MNLSPKEYDCLLRRDFVAFAQRSFYKLNPGKVYHPNWHIEEIAAALEECRTGKIRRLIINVPPRSLKSHLATICFPAYLLGHDPAARIICASYAQDLADHLAGSCRSLMMSDFYRRAFRSTRLASSRQPIHDFKTTLNGFRLATSVGGVLTGRGGDVGIIDDPLKPEDALSRMVRRSVNDWWDHTLISRLDDKAIGCLIVVMQRLHEDDLIGHLMAQPGWKLLRFPAIAEEDETHVIQTPYGVRTHTRRKGEALHPEREPLEILSEIRQSQGSYTFAAQYQQRPAPLGGGMVKLEWFKSYAPYELPQQFEMIVQSWDTANKTSDANDYSVCTTWGISNRHLYLLDVLRVRIEYPGLRRLVKSHARRFVAKIILIEDQASGTQLIQDLRADGVYETTAYQTKMDKDSRMSTASSLIENGFVHLPEQADWLDPYRHELSVFPNGQNDDQADSTSQMLDWVKQGMGAFWYLDFAREEFEKMQKQGFIPVETISAEEETAQLEQPASACGQCGNRNLSYCGVQGPSGDIEQSCNCGWMRRIARPAKVRPVPKIVLPTFEK